MMSSPTAKSRRKVGQTPIVNLRGMPDEQDWLDMAVEKLRTDRCTIVRMALEEFARNRGLPIYPTDPEINHDRTLSSNHRVGNN